MAPRHWTHVLVVILALVLMASEIAANANDTALCFSCIEGGSGKWCPSLNECLPGDTRGPYDVKCAAEVTSGQWTINVADCRCLSATSFEDLAGTDCGWCPYYDRAYIGTSYGPVDLTCPASDESGQWTWSEDNYRCLNAAQCTDIASIPTCGWCKGFDRSFIGDRYGPWDLKCSRTWIFDAADCWKDVPVAINDFKASDVTMSSALLHWTKPNQRGADIEQYRVTVNSNATFLISPLQTSFLLTDLVQRTQYTITVASRNSYGWSEESDILFVNTLGPTFQNNLLGAWLGSMTFYTDQCRKLETGTVLFDIGVNNITFNGTSQDIMNIIEVGNNYFSGIGSRTGEGVCLHLDMNQGSVKLQYGSNGSCPIIDPYVACIESPDDNLNLTSSRVTKLGLPRVTLPAGIFYGNFSFYSGNCTTETTLNVTATFKRDRIRIVSQGISEENVDILSISALFENSNNQYLGWINGMSVCLHVSEHGDVRIQYSTDGQCPTEEDQEPQCNFESMTAVFASSGRIPVPRMSIAWVYYVVAVVTSLALAFIVLICLCFMNYRGTIRRRDGYQTLYGDGEVEYLTNERCNKCFIYKDHHTSALCQRYLTTMKFIKAESDPDADAMLVRNITLAPDSNSYKSIESWLRLSWHKTTDFKINQVQKIVVYQNPILYRKYHHYLELVKNKEILQWHGSSPDNINKIMREGFKISKASSNITWSRFGNGIYFASNSSKSHEYSVGYSTNGSLGVARNWPTNTCGIILCRVATGRVKGYKNSIDKLKGAPFGHNAVEGVVGTDLNYPEIVVYDERAILPVCYIEYTFTKLF